MLIGLAWSDGDAKDNFPKGIPLVYGNIFAINTNRLPEVVCKLLSYEYLLYIVDGTK